MWQSIEGKLLPALRGAWQLALDRPGECALYVVLLLCLLALLVASLRRQEERRAFWTATAIVVFNSVFSWGDDSYTHIYRIAALADQFRHGELGMLLTNPTTGQVLPVFVFYSAVPYLAPTLLDLAGVPAVIAFKIALAAHFLLMAAGLQVLIDRTRGAGTSRPQIAADFLMAILFIMANYVYTLWCTRAALAELWVYSFIPWVVASIVAADARRVTTGWIFLQACGHPIVLAQSLVCELVAPLALSRQPVRELARRSLVPLAAALVLAVPFWLPQFLWKDFILGPAGLPDEFMVSFRTLGEMFHPRDFRSIGPWMPLGLVLLLVWARGRLSPRLWIVLGVWLAVMALQSTAPAALVAHVPVLNLSVFIWRFMLPASFLAFVVLLAGWRQIEAPPLRLLAAVVLLATAAMLWVSLYVAPSYFAKLANAGDDRWALVEYDRGDGIWGIREFLPKHALLPTYCPPAVDTQAAKYGELRKGLVVRSTYVVVPDGPTGLANYTAAQSTCRNDLVLGPLEPGETLRAAEPMLDALFYIRMLDLVLVAAAGWFLSRRPRTQG